MALTEPRTGAVPKTAVIGAESFIGRSLLAEYSKLHPNCVGTSRHPTTEGLARFDLLDPDVGLLKLAETGHEAAIICAAVTGLSQCEKDRELTRKINVNCTLKLFYSLSDQGILPIFLSSDNVFYGVKRDCYTEEDPPRPITEYGRQKAQVESEIRKSGRPHLIIRLSKVFGTKKGDGTFLTEAADKLVKGKEVLSASDLIFNPVWIEDAVRAILAVQANGLCGVMHICSPEIWSRYELMSALADRLRCKKSLVVNISLDNLPGLGLPKNLSMSCRRIQKETSVSFTPMASCLEAISREYGRCLQETTLT